MVPGSRYYLCEKRFAAEKRTSLRGLANLSQYCRPATWSLDGLDECVHVTSDKGRQEGKESHYSMRHLFLALVAQAQFVRQLKRPILVISVCHALALVLRQFGRYLWPKVLRSTSTRYCQVAHWPWSPAQRPPGQTRPKGKS